VGGTAFEDISGAIGSSYIVHPADIGRAIRVVVTHQGSEGIIASIPTIAIPSPTVTISGTPHVQQMLTATSSELNLTGASF
jgi:hypothetical protein